MTDYARMTDADIASEVAGRVMGWVYGKGSGGFEGWHIPGDGVTTYAHAVQPKTWSPTTDANAMMEVVERMLQVGRTEVIIKSPNVRKPKGWRVAIWAPHRPHGVNEPTSTARAGTVGRAVCIAVLQALQAVEQT